EAYEDVLIAGTSNGIYYTNAIGNWQQSTIEGKRVGTRAIAVKGDNLFAGTYGRILKSLDEGKSWTISNQIEGLHIKTITAADSFIFVSGDKPEPEIYYSVDDGHKWVPMNIDISSIIWSMAFKDSTLFIGTSSGIYSASFHDSTWNIKAEINLAGGVWSLVIKGDS
ncbi:MAG: hypothetical protein GWN00_37230, partial [Aliifodinibius sp.]|nr:hypothetical protein [Fodinibius sp.]NIV16269.1 hypothetical protein [Fodinibius sp.]NIY30225.1 hypothetical protein [Fodinibius sp.]